MTHTRKRSLAVAAALLGGCITRVPIVELDAEPSASPPDQASAASVCIRGGSCTTIHAVRTDKLDLLLVVDDAPGMARQQAALAAGLPQLLAALTSGKRSPDDPHPFAPPTDIHLGVISSDLGLPNTDDTWMCGSGDGARLQHDPHGTTCESIYPAFLSFRAEPGKSADPGRLAEDFACIARLGDAGCGIAQPLEAALKALWPTRYLDSNGQLVDPNPVQFLPAAMSGSMGLGDVAQADGGNRGFLRTNPGDGSSLLSIVVITHGDDCSIGQPDGFQPLVAPDGSLPQGSGPRCLGGSSALYETVARYGELLPKLRPTRPDLVTFSAIVGVPGDLIHSIDMHDASQRNTYYDAILNDPRMREQIDPGTPAGSSTANIHGSCEQDSPDPAQITLAFPPRRIVEVARSFGANGTVQSICQDDLGPALGAIVDTMAPHFSADCLAQPLTRQADGKVACDVIWQLPKTAEPGSPTPTTCQAQPFLIRPTGKRRADNPLGGESCVVQQLAVKAGRTDRGAGWFYDDFSEDAQQQCPVDHVQRIAFSADAQPPSGVRVVVDCATDA